MRMRNLHKTSEFRTARRKGPCKPVGEEPSSSCPVQDLDKHKWRSPGRTDMPGPVRVVLTYIVARNSHRPCLACLQCITGGLRKTHAGRSTSVRAGRAELADENPRDLFSARGKTYMKIRVQRNGATPWRADTGYSCQRGGGDIESNTGQVMHDGVTGPARQHGRRGY